jgi:hypothetical protein
MIQRPTLRLKDGVVKHAGSNIIYLNPCWGNCTIKSGWDNSRTNTSSIPNGTSTVSEYAYGQASFNSVVSCVRAMYEPFGVEIVTEDPGNVEHFEAIVAGRPGEVGMSNGVGGVSPFDCGVIDNAITFTFANVYGGSVQAICETVAQETAHAFGMDHEYHCPDPMTYLGGCGPKEFRDVDAQCGEYNARQCQCGGSTQNSYEWLIDLFGPSAPTPPTVAITFPADGAEVQPGFPVRSDVMDNVDVARAELWLNNQMVQSLNNPPFAFNAPADLSQGAINVEVRAYDNNGDMGSDSIAVVLGEPCGGPSDCADGETCVDGRCVPGPGSDGGLGEDCTSGDDCASGLCGNDGANQFCAEECAVGADGCPDGFQCLDTGIGGVCWPGGGDGGGGCRSGNGGGAASAGLLALIALVLFRRRRT